MARPPGQGHGSKSGLQKGALLLALLGAFAIAGMFFHDHSHLHHLSHGHDTGSVAYADWQHVYDMVKHSKDEDEFLSKIKSGHIAGVMDGGKPFVFAQHNPIQQQASQAAAAQTQAAQQAFPVPRLDAPPPPVVTQVIPAAQTTIVPQINTMPQTTTVTQVNTAGSTTSGSGSTRWQAGSGEGMDPELRPINGGPPRMSVKLAQSVAVNHTIVVTWANHALFDFVNNWVQHLRKLGYTNYIVGAMDKDIGTKLVAMGVPAFAMYEVDKEHSGVGTDHIQWGGADFHKMGRQKIALAKLFLSTQLTVLLVDADVVIVGDAIKYCEGFPEADILVSSDILHSTLKPGDQGLEIPAEAGAPMNIGIMYFRYTPLTVKFVDAWLDVITKDDKYWDQTAFNDLARAGWDPVGKLHPTNKRVFMGYNSTIGVGVLPVASFSGGHTFYVQKLYEIQLVPPMAVHATFQYGGNMGKRNRMREAMIFEDPPEYWTGSKYVSVHVGQAPDKAPADFQKLTYAEKKVYNRQGLGQQLAPVYSGIGLAHMFNRTIIFPPIACYCDRYWAPLDECKLPGATQQRLPFTCPQDYVLDPIALTDDVSTLVVRWREHSFLENPRCPTSLKQSKLTVRVDPAATKPTEQHSAEDAGPSLVIPPNLSEAQLRDALKQYEHIQHWHFKDAVAAFQAGFAGVLEQKEYRKRIDHIQPIVQPENM